MATIAEVGRQLIREQRAVGGDALPRGDEQDFAALMVTGATVVLDRGAPDMVAFLRAAAPSRIARAVHETRYNARVFCDAHQPDRNDATLAPSASTA